MRKLLAEGEYQISTRSPEGGAGPFDPQVFNFHESWSLWRVADGRYEVEGERNFESPKDEFHKDRFWLRLTRDWRLERIKEYARLRWRPDSGPLTCDLEDAGLHCNSNAKDPRQAIRLDLKLDHPYGFLWPISAFSLSSIAKAQERRANAVMPVQVITIEEPSPENPVSPTILDGHLRYLGKSDLTIANRRWKADQFELEAALNPKLRFATAPEGFLLDLAVEDPTGGPPRAEMKLVHYRQWSAFSTLANP